MSPMVRFCVDYLILSPKPPYEMDIITTRLWGWN